MDVQLKNVRPVEDLVKRPDKLLKEIEKKGERVLLTRQGKAAVVIEDADAYEGRLERIRYLRSILRGLAAAKRGEAVSEGNADREINELLK